MTKQVWTLYDVCICNHEYMQHHIQCSANIPIGQKFFRGILPNDVKIQMCGCKTFRFSKVNTTNPKPTLQGDD